MLFFIDNHKEAISQNDNRVKMTCRYDYLLSGLNKTNLPL